MGLATRPITPELDVEILDLDLPSLLAEGVSDELCEDLLQLWREYGAILVR